MKVILSKVISHYLFIWIPYFRISGSIAEQALIMRIDSNEGESMKKTKGTLAMRGRELANGAWECIAQVIWVFTLYTQLAALVPSNTSKWRTLETESNIKPKSIKVGQNVGSKDFGISKFVNLLLPFLFAVDYYSLTWGTCLFTPCSLPFHFSSQFEEWKLKDTKNWVGICHC